eukprot:3792648-Rhodomonas_salina.1
MSGVTSAPTDNFVGTRSARRVSTRALRPAPGPNSGLQETNSALAKCQSRVIRISSLIAGSAAMHSKRH